MLEDVAEFLYFERECVTISASCCYLVIVSQIFIHLYYIVLWREIGVYALYKFLRVALVV